MLLWYNQDILQNGRCFLLIKFLKIGIWYVHDLFDVDGSGNITNKSVLKKFKKKSLAFKVCMGGVELVNVSGS